MTPFIWTVGIFCHLMAFHVSKDQNRNDLAEISPGGFVLFCAALVFGTVYFWVNVGWQVGWLAVGWWMQ